MFRICSDESYNSVIKRYENGEFVNVRPLIIGYTSGIGKAIFNECKKRNYNTA